MRSQFNQGDVVLATFPFTNLTGIKKRPVLIISGAWYNNTRKDVIVLPLTTQIKKDNPRDEYVLSEEELKDSGLNHKSVLKLGKPMTLQKNMLLKKFGSISPNSTRKIIKYFTDVLGYPDLV